MAQEKVKVTMSDGTYRIIPVDNIDNVRRVMGYNIQSIENYSTTKTIISKEKNVKKDSDSLLKKDKNEVELIKKKEKLIEAGFEYNDALREYSKGKMSITIEKLLVIKPMQLGKLIKSRTN